MSALTDAIRRFDLGAYIDENFDQVLVAREGEELRINCFAPGGCGYSDEKQHLYVNIEKNTWYCFKCGYGDPEQHEFSSWLPRFIADVEKIPIGVAIDKILGKHTPLPEDELSTLLEQAFNNPGKKKRERKVLDKIEMPKYFFRSWETTMPSIPYQKFIKSRGMDFDDTRFFNVRYSFASRDRYWQQRIIFPVYDLKGVCRTAVGRLITNNKEKAPWVNWPKTDLAGCLWPLGSFVNKHTWKRYKFGSVLVLTEGVFDALAVNKLTSFQALCTFGKKVSVDQIDMLKKLGVRTLIMGFDKDAKKQIKALSNKLKVSFDVYFFPFKSPIWQNEDFGDILKNPTPQRIELLESELRSPIHCDSLDVIGWSMS